MPHLSPLVGAKPNSVSVCGKMLTSGQTITVPTTAIGPLERGHEKKKRIKIRASNEKGMSQITCIL